MIACPHCGKDTLLFVPPDAFGMGGTGPAPTASASISDGMREALKANHRRSSAPGLQTGPSPSEQGGISKWLRQHPPMEKLRKRSAYSRGRTVVRVLLWISTAAAMISIIAFLVELVGNANVYGAVDNTTPWIGIAVSIAIALWAWVTWELANAVFDIADCALKRHEDSN